MPNIDALVRARRSVRTFDQRPLAPEDLAQIQTLTAQTDNPYGLPVAFKWLDAKKDNLSCPVVVGTDLYVGAKIQKAPHLNEAVGYSFERLVLHAQALGLGTVWIGGTMDREAFERAMALSEDEVMPCVSPLGYPAAKMSLRETVMRKGVKADSRLAFEELFFDRSFDVPLTREKAGKLAHALEMVRLAPSAVNKQPWRVVLTPSAAHFYLKRSKNFGGGVLDMQKMDLGIALCHFELAAQEAGLSPRFVLADPGIPLKDGEIYIASYRV